MARPNFINSIMKPKPLRKQLIYNHTKIQSEHGNIMSFRVIEYIKRKHDKKRGNVII